VRCVQFLLGDEVQLEVNYRHPSLRYTDSEICMELDIFIPSLSLAFEYQVTLHIMMLAILKLHVQGVQHYVFGGTLFSNSTVNVQVHLFFSFYSSYINLSSCITTHTNLMQHRDAEKRTACLKQGITLIEVPYWWDLDKESLAGKLA
jgi:hypothetical protein